MGLLIPDESKHRFFAICRTCGQLYFYCPHHSTAERGVDFETAQRAAARTLIAFEFGDSNLRRYSAREIARDRAEIAEVFGTDLPPQ